CCSLRPSLPLPPSFPTRRSSDLIRLLGLPPLPALLASMASVFALGIVLERLLLTPLYSERTERKDEYGLIVTFGLAFLLRNLARSEEHTSELQSHLNLVCRLLLE